MCLKWHMLRNLIISFKRIYFYFIFIQINYFFLFAFLAAFFSSAFFWSIFARFATSLSFSPFLRLSEVSILSRSRFRFLLVWALLANFTFSAAITSSVASFLSRLAALTSRLTPSFGPWKDFIVVNSQGSLDSRLSF